MHAEAEVLEHALSEELEELIAAKLGNPTIDPHGDPIPSRELKLAETTDARARGLEPGETATLRPRLGRRPRDAPLPRPSAASARARALELVERQPFDGPLFVRAGKKVHVLGATLARAMRVERKNGEP